jgi:hypothetical protein
MIRFPTFLRRQLLLTLTLSACLAGAPTGAAAQG